MNKAENNSTIVFVIPNLKIGGAQRIFVNYIRSINKDKFNIYLILINKAGSFVDQIPNHVKMVNLDIRRTRFGFFKLLNNIKRINPDLIVSTTNYLNLLVLFASIFVSKKTRVCLYEPSMPSAQIKNKHFPKYYFWLMRVLYTRADYIIAQTDEMKEEIIRYYAQPKNDIIVTINPLDKELINSQLDGVKNPYLNDKINVIVSGRISKEKGQDFLVQSFEEVVRKNANFKLNILGAIGNREYYDELLKLVEDLNITEHIEFLGFKNNPYPYYKYADLLVLPSRWEGLPNVVLEAFFLQTPVVVTNCIPFFKRFIKDGKNGYVVETDDITGMSKAILNYSELIVDKEIVPEVDMEQIFNKMIFNE